MMPRQPKAGYFALEGLNAFATAFYLYYLFFFLQAQFGFGNFGNLSVSALNGLIYVCSAWFGGRFAQRKGYFRALKLGFGIMAICLLIGLGVSSATGHVLVMMFWTFGMCFTWPTLEALVSEKETPLSLPRRVGIYNVVWSGGSALAYFTGGALIEWLGMRSIFVIPAAIHLAQFALAAVLEKRAALNAIAAANSREAVATIPPNPRPIAQVKLFQRLAWVANPFAYIAISTVIPLIPGLALALNLSPMQAGFFCSTWFFARTATFALLWFWTGWHYRFGLLIGAFALMIAGFAGVLLARDLWFIVLAQVVFGFGLGLIYYSSLFYSMDASETHGEHGGIHEAAIGLGIFLGPAIGATALRFLPQYPHSATWAVSGLLVAGLGLQLVIRRRRKSS